MILGWQLFPEMTPETQTTKEKTDKLDFITIKTLCIRGHCEEVKRQDTEQEKVFSNHLTEANIQTI